MRHDPFAHHGPRPGTCSRHASVAGLQDLFLYFEDLEGRIPFPPMQRGTTRLPGMDLGLATPFSDHLTR